jgi:hypothetical protein
VCISLLDPKRLASASYQAFRSNLSHGALVTASPETIDGMLESLGECWIFFCTFVLGFGLSINSSYSKSYIALILGYFSGDLLL